MKRTHFIIDLFVPSEDHPVEIFDLLYDDLDLGAVESLLIDLEEHNLTVTARCEIWDEP